MPSHEDGQCKAWMPVKHACADACEACLCGCRAVLCQSDTDPMRGRVLYRLGAWSRRRWEHTAAVALDSGSMKEQARMSNTYDILVKRVSEYKFEMMRKRIQRLDGLKVRPPKRGTASRFADDACTILSLDQEEKERFKHVLTEAVMNGYVSERLFLQYWNAEHTRAPYSGTAFDENGKDRTFHDPREAQRFVPEESQAVLIENLPSDICGRDVRNAFRGILGEDKKYIQFVEVFSERKLKEQSGLVLSPKKKDIDLDSNMKQHEWKMKRKIKGDFEKNKRGISTWNQSYALVYLPRRELVERVCTPGIRIFGIALDDRLCRVAEAPRYLYLGNLSSERAHNAKRHPHEDLQNSIRDVLFRDEDVTKLDFDLYRLTSCAIRCPTHQDANRFFRKLWGQQLRGSDIIVGFMTEAEINRYTELGERQHHRFL